MSVLSDRIAAASKAATDAQRVLAQAEGAERRCQIRLDALSPSVSVVINYARANPVDQEAQANAVLARRAADEARAELAQASEAAGAARTAARLAAEKHGALIQALAVAEYLAERGEASR